MRVSATTLESYRRLLLAEGELAETIEADLIAKIQGHFVWTPEMRLGSAYHAIIEKPERSLSGYYESDGFLFEADAIHPMLDLIDPRGMFEVKMTREILVPGQGLVTLVAKTDYLYGVKLDEFKTTLGTFDAEKYTASFQWRMMALLFEPQTITYRVACLKDDPKSGVIGLRSIENLAVYPYAQLEADVRSLVRDFCHYARVKKLESYLEPHYPTAPVSVPSGVLL